jgi:hypothetical protein
MKELIKKLFTRKKPSQTQEVPIYKSLNAATILVNIMLEQNNVSSNNPIKQPQMIRKKTNQTTNK